MNLLACGFDGLSELFFSPVFRLLDLRVDLMDLMVSRLLVLRLARTRALSSNRTAKERTHMSCSIFVWAWSRKTL